MNVDRLPSARLALDLVAFTVACHRAEFVIASLQSGEARAVTSGYDNLDRLRSASVAGDPYDDMTMGMEHRYIRQPAIADYIRAHPAPNYAGVIT